MVSDTEILAFFRGELSRQVNRKLQTVPLELETLLQDYAPADELPYVISDYSNKYGVDISALDMRNYFPWENLPFTTRVFKGRNFRASVIANRKPLTVKMFAESARAGRWLYD
ncbi:DUF1493 family protein [Pantoea alhagi]|uniref:DUF1493 family protein n=1 Tax=Pantoea alhagi TaxID=1891675 RepID=UPI00202AD095|nr:DUF1493 family protein [Pantoea alhagi]URQ61366.1 DUF1493 family protein [Pantoea alhagi]